MERIEAEIFTKVKTPFLQKVEERKDQLPPFTSIIEIGEHSGRYESNRMIFMFVRYDEGLDLRVHYKIMQGGYLSEIKSEHRDFFLRDSQGRKLKKGEPSVLTLDNPEISVINKKTRQIYRFRIPSEPLNLEPLEPNPIGIKPDKGPSRLTASVALEHPKQNP